MYQMTLFFLIVIYKKKIFNQYSRKDIKLHHFSQIFWGEHVPEPL